MENENKDNIKIREKKKLISVVIVNYNCGSYIESAILSVLNQSCEDYELLIVDGGSTDNSVEIIKKYAERIKWWVSEPDKGQSDAFNKGFAKAAGEYFMWLNADDLLLPGALEAATRYLCHRPDCNWLACDTIYFNNEGRITRCLYGPLWNTWLMKQTTLCNMVNGPSSIFRHTLFEKVGGMDTKLNYVMDLDLWIKFVDAGAKFHRLHHYLWAFRIHEGSKTSHSIGHRQNDEFKQEVHSVIVRAKRVRTRAEFWCLRIHKLLTGTHFHTLYDTWRWRGLPIERFILALNAKDAN